MKKLRFFGLIGLMVVVWVIISPAQHKTTLTTVQVKCVAGPNEICPSDQFYSDMQRVKELGIEINKKQNTPPVREWRDAIDLRNGIIDRLNPQILEQNKKGFKYADETGKFVKMTPDELKQFIVQTNQTK